jgi:hypothetical protein
MADDVYVARVASHLVFYHSILCKFECGKKFSLSFAVQHCMFFWEGF